MGKTKAASYILVLLALVVIIGASYLIIAYATDILTAIVDFVTTNDFAKLRQCGVVMPEQFNKVKGDLTAVILPAMYLGLPLLLIIIGAIMFAAGMQYKKSKLEEEVERHEKMEREMVDRIAKKMNHEPPPRQMPPSKPMMGRREMEHEEEEHEEEQRPTRPTPRR
ncbi:hypothetical protein HY988_02190 [Candidatus Micrarchaeota archaeon]|nr:hypothetical protein [Candidatus Micrarchaeota archaeon]